MQGGWHGTFDLEKKAEKGVPHEEYENWINFISREKHWFEVLRYIMKNEPCHLTAIVFDGVDKLLHIGFKYLFPGSFLKTPPDLKIRELCLEYFHKLDSFIGETVAIAGPDARIL